MDADVEWLHLHIAASLKCFLLGHVLHLSYLVLELRILSHELLDFWWKLELLGVHLTALELTFLDEEDVVNDVFLLTVYVLVLADGMLHPALTDSRELRVCHYPEEVVIL